MGVALFVLGFLTGAKWVVGSVRERGPEKVIERVVEKVVYVEVETKPRVK